MIRFGGWFNPMIKKSGPTWTYSSSGANYKDPDTFEEGNSWLLNFALFFSLIFYLYYNNMGGNSVAH